jgi:hypothetical protein
MSHGIPEPLASQRTGIGHYVVSKKRGGRSTRDVTNARPVPHPGNIMKCEPWVSDYYVNPDIFSGFLMSLRAVLFNR